MYNYLIWLLRSPLARGPVLFDLKVLIEDGNLRLYMYCVYAQKIATGAPRIHFRVYKSHNFLVGCAPRPPFTQSIL